MKITTVVTGAVYTNTYILTDEATGDTAVVDPGEYTAELADVCAQAGWSSIKYILLTHCHFDHILGVCALREKTGAKVVICAPDDEALGSGRLNGAVYFGFGDDAFPAADIVVHDGDRIYIGSLELTVMHTPGHTPGSCCYICGDVIFCGDTVFAYGGYGRTDLPGGSISELKKSLDRIFSLEQDYRLLPGHEDTSTLKKERMRRTL